MNKDVLTTIHQIVVVVVRLNETRTSFTHNTSHK